MTAKWECVGDGLHVARMPDGRELRVVERESNSATWGVGRLDSPRAETGGHCDTAEQARQAAERAWAEMQPSPPADPRTDCERRHDDQPLPTPSENPAIVDLLIASIQARAAKGLTTYGQPLRAFNGRDPLRDLEEELLDGAMYARQLREEWDALRAENERLRANRDAEAALSHSRGEALREAHEAILIASEEREHILRIARYPHAWGLMMRDAWARAVGERDALRAEVEKLRRSVDLHRLTLDEERRCHNLARAEVARLTALLRDRDGPL